MGPLKPEPPSQWLYTSSRSVRGGPRFDFWYLVVFSPHCCYVVWSGRSLERYTFLGRARSLWTWWGPKGDWMRRDNPEASPRLWIFFHSTKRVHLYLVHVERVTWPPSDWPRALDQISRVDGSFKPTPFHVHRSRPLSLSCSPNTNPDFIWWKGNAELLFTFSSFLCCSLYFRYIITMYGSWWRSLQLTLNRNCMLWRCLKRLFVKVSFNNTGGKLIIWLGDST